MDFFGLSVTPEISAFIEKNMKSKITADESKYANVMSTVRNPQFEKQQWMQELNIDSIIKIQNNCSEAMRLWGYKILKSEEELKPTNPVLNFTSRYAIS